MIPHLKKSRIVKALTDRNDNGVDFDAAESRLAQVRVAIMVSQRQAVTAAGQAATLTAVLVSGKCFGGITLIANADTRLLRPLPYGASLGDAAKALGATLATSVPADATHVIDIGEGSLADVSIFVRCWWDGWIAGVLPSWDSRGIGSSGNPLSGVFAGALAIREIFSTVLGNQRAGTHVSVTSLWEPWLDPDIATHHTGDVYMPSNAWFIGLGHLGQGCLWSMGMLPMSGSHAILQDDQVVGEENEATGLLTNTDDVNAKNKKTRVASRWLEKLGWTTSLIERRHFGDMKLQVDDPAIVIAGLDDPRPRRHLASMGFDYFIDTGVGHGPMDYDNMQIHVIRKGSDTSQLWVEKDTIKDVDGLLEKPAYRAYGDKFGECGKFTLATASVAVPFVGAAVGAIAIAQAIRIASMKATMQIMQMDLGAPGMTLSGSMNGAPTSNIGGARIRL